MTEAHTIDIASVGRYLQSVFHPGKNERGHKNNPGSGFACMPIRLSPKTISSLYQTEVPKRGCRQGANDMMALYLSRSNSRVFWMVRLMAPPYHPGVS